MAGVPPTVHDVALRALCLAAVSTAGAYATALVAEPDAAGEVDEAAADLIEWVEEDGVEPGLSDGERALLESPLTEWSDLQRVAAGGRAESLGVLLWALSLVDELPPWDEPFDAVEEVPLGETPDELSERSRLRAAEELERARDVADLWQWRAAAAGGDLDVVGGTARSAFDAGDIPQPIDGDFPALAKAYRDLDELEGLLVRSIASERHTALVWLCGGEAGWGIAGLDGSDDAA